MCVSAVTAVDALRVVILTAKLEWSSLAKYSYLHRGRWMGVGWVWGEVRAAGGGCGILGAASGVCVR